MSLEGLQSTADSLRSTELRRAMRGVDGEQARELLEKAADALHAAAREQATLRRELDRLRKEQDAVGEALLVAVRRGEEIIAEAGNKAASITAQAEAAYDLARAEAEHELTDARRELARLETEAAGLRSTVADTQHRVVEIAQSALEQLEALGASTGTECGSDLLADLRPATPPLDVPAN
jgi:cell division septum initiation protein DivIVA